MSTTLNPTLPTYHHAPLSRRGLTLVVVLHVLTLAALVRLEVVTLPVLPVLSVSLLTAAPTAAQPKSTVIPPRLRPESPRPPSPTTTLALPAPASPAEPPIAPVKPLDDSTRELTSKPAPAAPPSAEQPTPNAPAVPAPTPPRFDAAYLDNPRPAYPPLSRRLGEQGRVVLRVMVAASGLPTELSLHQSSGVARLDQAALDTVRRWKFVPARLGSEALAGAVLVPIVFSLKD